MSMGMFFWVKKVVPFLIVAADGSGDFTDIQAAIDALPITGGEIHVKAGTYTITEFIDVNKDNVTIKGAGISTKVTTIVNIRVFNVAGNYCTISNLQVYGSGGGANDGILVNFNNAHTRIDNCIIDNCDDGIVVDYNTEDTYIVGCLIQNNAKNGITTPTLPFQFAENTHVINCRFYNNDLDGINIERSNNWEIRGNICDDNSSDGIAVVGNSDNNIVEGNQCINNGAYGITITSVNGDNNIVSGNILNNNTSGNLNDSGTGTQIGHNIET